MVIGIATKPAKEVVNPFELNQEEDLANLILQTTKKEIVEGITLPMEITPTLPKIITMIVGGQLQNYWKQWEQIGASDYVVNILRYGLTLEFKEL